MFGISPSHLYHRPTTSTNLYHKMNVLSMDTLDPNSPSIANKQCRKQLTALYEDDVEILKEKLSHIQNILSILKNYTSQPRRVQHGHKVNSTEQTLNSFIFCTDNVVENLVMLSRGPLCSLLKKHRHLNSHKEHHENRVLKTYANMYFNMFTMSYPLRLL